MAEVVEIRCVDSPRRLFARLLLDEQPVIVPGNLIEFACRDCAKARNVRRVLHRFNVAGELIESEVVR